MEGSDATPKPPSAPRRRMPARRIVLALVVAVVVVAATLFVLSLPPQLTIHEGMTYRALLANFPTTNSGTNMASGKYMATTYANQTAGPSSNLTVFVGMYGAAVGMNYVIQGVEMNYAVEVVGRFAPNLRLGSLQFSFNQTAPGAPANFWDGPGMPASYLYNVTGAGANVSASNEQAFAVTANGSGGLTVNLLNAGGPGPFYEFAYWAHGESYMGYQGPKFLEFRATVTGWILPPISAAVGVGIRNVPKTFTLFQAGTGWKVGGSNLTAWSVPTMAPFVVTGALNATGPATAYIADAVQLPYGSGAPATWEWKADLGPVPTPVNVTLLPPGNDWYFVFTTGGAGVSVYASQAIVATT